MALKYKVGDRVRIKSIDWYNRHTNGIEVDCEGVPFTSDMKKFCSRVMTISFVHADCYTMVEDLENYYTDEMIECKVEDETKPKFKVGDIIVKAHLRFRIVKVECDRYIVEETPGINLVVLFKDQDKYRLVAKFKVNDRVKWYNHTCNITAIDTDKDIYTYLIKHEDYREDKSFAKWVPENELTFEDEETSIKLTGKAIKNNEMVVSIDEYTLPDGYIFKDENGNIINAQKIVLEKKKKEYPKTFVDCCAILYPNENFQSVSQRVKGHKGDLLFRFQKLLICRDAYWKLYGDEMGLRKPWEPNLNHINRKFYCIYNSKNNIVKKMLYIENKILAFPTAEIRDDFYENFNELIEECKDFL